MAYEILKILIDVAKNVVGFGEKLNRMKIEERARIATYLDNISATISDVALVAERDESVNIGREGAHCCGRISRYLYDIKEVMEGVVSKPELTKLEFLLDQAHHSRAWAFIESEAGSRPKAIQALSEIAGYYKAVADKFRT